MALLKAFVCQVILLGLYKLFLEKVVEEQFVPDELTRNCLVGFVCLLCFGIQLYTDKAGDDDNAEADESPKAKSESRGGKSVESLNGKQVGDSKKRSSAISSIEAEKVTDVGHSDVFAQFPPYMRNVVPNVKADGMGKPEVSASTAQTSYDQEMTNIPVLNGFSETNVCEELDEDDIEIDKFVANESTKSEVEKSRTVKAEEVEAIKSENVTKTIVESESLEINGEDFSASQDMKMTTTSNIGQSSEAEISNGIAEESLININNVSNIIDEVKSAKSVKDEGKSGNRQETTLSAEPYEQTKGSTTESLPSAQEIGRTSSPPTKTTNNVETMNNSNEEITLVKTASSSEKLIVSTIQNTTAAGDVYFTPVTIDISFIYACH